MRFSRLVTFVTAAALFIAPAAAQAQITVYTTFADFLAATSNVGIDSFDDLNGGVSYDTPLSRAAGSHGYTANTNTLGFFPTGSDADRWLSTDVSTDIVTFDGFGSTVRGVGGFFFGTDFDGLFQQGVSLVVTATSASGSESRTVFGTPGSFLGFVSTDALLSLTLQTETQGIEAWPTVNDFVVANAATTVPEPSTFVLLAIGVAGLLVVVKRRAA